MSTLLLKLVGNRSFNRTIWPPHLYVYDDLLIYKKRNFFRLKEMTISYNQISQCTLTSGIFFASLDVITTGTDDIFIRFISKSKGRNAKKIIDQKIYHAHAKHQTAPAKDNDQIKSFEKSLSRLEELLARGKISEREFENKRHKLLREID